MTDRPGNTIRNLVFAVDLGGTYMRVALVDQTGRILTHHRRDTPKTNDAADIVRALVDAMHECGRAFASETGPIYSASIMVPGFVDRNNEVVVQVPNLPSLNHFALKTILEAQLGWSVFLDNDANAAAVGETWLGAARGYRSIICVTLGTGVGGGIILDGKLWRGADGAAGEIGHTTVDPFGGIKCKCGNTGCLEMFASATAIVRMACEGLVRHSESILRGEGLSAKKVYEAGLQGDALALEVLKKMGTYLGIGLANLINLLNPEIVVLAGGVVNGWALFEEEMRRQVAERAFPSLVERVKIVPAECGDNAGLLGAARLAFDRIQDF